MFVERVSLPRGLEREHVRFRDHDYTLRGSESRTLASVGAFRVVPANDLRDSFNKPLDPRHGELWHLRDAGLVQTVRLDRDASVVTLTREGRDLLESWRLEKDSPHRQAFHHGVQRPRELKHDADVYRAYLEEAERLHEMGAHIQRVVLGERAEGGVPGVPAGAEPQPRRCRRTAGSRSAGDRELGA